MATWTTRLNVTLRTNATEFDRAWTPYLSAIADVVKSRQIIWDGDSPGKGVSGGSVIAVQAGMYPREASATVSAKLSPDSYFRS